MHLDRIPASRTHLDILTCLAVAVLLSAAQATGAAAVLLAVLLLFLLVHLSFCRRDDAFSALLFFLPWSRLLKLGPGGLSFFTIALLVTGVYYLARRRLAIRCYQIVCAGTLAALTLAAKAVQGNSLSNSYLLFLFLLVVFPSFALAMRDALDFEKNVLFFALGIISSAVVAFFAAGLPNVSRYIVDTSYLSITRFAGFYSDPNFFSALVTACMAGIMLVLQDGRSHLGPVLSLGLLVALVYCGMMSASKSFVLVAALMFVVWFFLLLTHGGHRGRSLIVLALVLAAVVAFLSPAFAQLSEVILERFAYRSNVNDLSTGRVEIWLNYLDVISRDPALLLLGEGYSQVVIDGRASHNTLLQSLFQLGLVGVPFLAAWFVSALGRVTQGPARRRGDGLRILLLLVGALLPWMALDMLFFDELFLMPLFVALGVCCMRSGSKAEPQHNS